MSRSRWFSIIAIVGWLVLAGLALAQTPDNKGVPNKAPAIESKTTEQPNASQNTAEKFSVPVRIIESPVDAEHAQAREQKSDEHDANDLDAQIRSAQAAEKQIRIAYLSAFFALLGTGLLVWNLTEARKANALTIKAIGQEQANARRGLRAYIAVDRLTLIIASDGTPSVEITVKNSGQTPAYETVIATALVTSPLPITTMISPAHGGSAPKTILGAGGEFTITAHLEKVYGPDRQTENIAKRSALVVSGNVLYVDVFNAKRWMNFHFYITGSFHITPNTEIFTPCIIGNDASEPEKT